jgi:hypothetical protein
VVIVTRIDEFDHVCKQSRMTIEIKLTKGYVALIDDEDAHLAKMTWYAHTAVGKKTVYARTSVPREGKSRGSLLLHRAVMNAGPDDPIVDHKDGDGLNCTRANLHYVTASQNACNRSGPRSDNQFSPYLGVHFRKSANRYLAQITIRGKKHHLGCFKTAEEAHEARVKAEADLWGVMPRRTEHHS